LSEAKIAKAWSAGCSRNIIIAVAAFVIITTAFTFLGVLVVILPIQGDRAANLWFAGFFVFLFLFLALVIILAGWMIRRRLRLLDSLFTPLGISGKAYLLTGRQYHGRLSGRQVDAYFSRGPSLDIYMSSALNTHMGIGLKGRITQSASGSLNGVALASHDPDLDHLSIFSLDKGWGRQLLDDPRSREIILRLTARQPGFEFRNLLLQPEAIHFQLAHVNKDNLVPEIVQGWFYDLLELAQGAESLPPPEVSATASVIEQKTRLSRGDFTLPAVGITCAALAMFLLIFVIGLVLVFTLTGE